MKHLTVRPKFKKGCNEFTVFTVWLIYFEPKLCTKLIYRFNKYKKEIIYFLFFVN